MSKPKKDEHFVKKPIYPGGLAAMRKLIAKELRYPNEALKQKIEGSVYVRYGIDYQGKVAEVKILQGLGYGCDEEAIRVVRLLKFQVPKSPRKVKVGFHKKIRIHFKMPKAAPKQKAKKAQSALSFEYNVVPNKTTPEAPTDKKSSYSYTIKY